MRPMGLHARIAGLAMLALVSGCVTAAPIVYGPLGPGGYGYVDSANKDGSTTVTIIVPDAPTGRNFFERRAAELCTGEPVQKSIFSIEQRVERVTGFTGAMVGGVYTSSTYSYPAYGAIVVEGLVRCAAPTAPSTPASEAAPAVAPQSPAAPAPETPTPPATKATDAAKPPEKTD